MKKTLIFLSIIFFGCVQKSYSQKVDTSALQIVQNSLKIIDSYLKDVNSDPTHKRARAIAFLSYLTGIPSQSDGTYIGQLSPTKQDLTQWTNWLFFYKGYLRWDNEKKVIIVSKEVEVPEDIRF